MGITYNRSAILTIVLALSFNFAFAADVAPSAPAKTGTNSSNSSKMVKYDGAKGSKFDCPFPIQELSLAGMKFLGKAFCVGAKNDNEAATACGGYNRAAINPYNKQYLIENGARDSNEGNWYFCVERNPSSALMQGANGLKAATLAGDSNNLNSKAVLCNLASRASPWKEQFKPLSISMQAVEVKGASVKDVNCNCSTDFFKNDDEGVLCDNAFLASLPALQQAAIAVQQASAAPAATVAVPNPAAASSPASPVATSVPDEFQACIDKYSRLADKCRSEAEKAVHSCDQKNNDNKGNNSTYQTVGGVTGMMGQMYQMKNAGAGMQAECFRAGAIANTAQAAVGEMKETCEMDYSSCNSACKSDTPGKTKYDEFRDECSAKANRSITQMQSDPTAAGQQFQRAGAEIKSVFDEGTKSCTEKAKNNKDLMSGLLNGIGQALQGSLRCVCQTSTAGGDCNAIPTPQDCSAIPQPAGCDGYQAMDLCTPGSPTYNAKTCGCMQNPATPGCSGSSQNISSFAGPPLAGGVAQGVASSPNFGSGAGARATDLGSLGGGSNDVDSSDAGLTMGKGGAPGPSGSGGAGSSSGGATGNGAIADKPPEVPEEKGLTGMFNQAKSYMANMLGGKSKANGASPNGALGKPDMSKFRPLRGLAGNRSGMGSRNMDIWKMMNSCTSGDTCKSNENNYITTP